MTDSTQELDEILNDGDGVLHCCGDYQEAAKRAILDWHNKQVDEAIYLFHWFVMEADIIRPEDDQAFNYARLHKAIDYYIAEHKKLREGSDVTK